MIIRGIGYRVYHICNDNNLGVNSTFNYSINTEFPNTSYLIVRAGHTTDLYQPIPAIIGIKISKKDRKLVIFCTRHSRVNYWANIIANYRRPSVYTGRGIRLKGVKITRKAGKKDKQKGKAF